MKPSAVAPMLHRGLGLTKVSRPRSCQGWLPQSWTTDEERDGICDGLGVQIQRLGRHLGFWSCCADSGVSPIRPPACPFLLASLTARALIVKIFEFRVELAPTSLKNKKTPSQMREAVGLGRGP